MRRSEWRNRELLHASQRGCAELAQRDERELRLSPGRGLRRLPGGLHVRIVDHSYARCERHLQPGDLDNRQLQLSFSRKNSSLRASVTKSSAILSLMVGTPG